MMNNYPNQTNISSFPAYSVNGSPDEDQSRRKKKRMIIVFSIAGAVILLAAIIVIAVVILSKKPDTGYEEYKAMTQVRLESDKAAFYTDDDAKAQFSVTLPSSMLNKEFVLRNANGKAEHSINTSKMKVDENGALTYTFPLEIDTKSGGMQTFTASVGEYQSAELNVFITPHITLDHILKSFEVGNDVTSHLQAKYPGEKDGEKLAKAAKAFLEKDERVGEVSVNGTDVYYSTVDSIAGMVRCGATATETGAAASSPKKSGKAADSSTGTKFSRESEILTAYAASDLNADGTHIDSGNTCSNGNVLILRPASGALPESDFDGNLADGAELVRETAAGDATDELTDDNAVRAILTGRLTDYGTVVLHAPGQAEKDADGKVCNVTFLLYSIAAEQPDEESDGVPVTMRKKVSQYAAMFYGKKKASALTDEQIGDFCSSFYGSAKDPSGWRLYSCWNVQQEQGSLAMSSRYLMNIYNGRTLDNAVVYFDTYSALGLVSFNEWMINHGAKLLLGYEKPIEGDATLKDFRDVFTQLTSGSESDDWRTQNPYEASGMLGNLLTGRIFNADAEEVAPEMVYCGNPSFFYSGTGSIRGKVLYKDEEAENEDERITPCEGATVTAYLWHNKQFLEQKKATTDSKGQFVIEDVRCGAYVLKIQDAKGSKQTVSLIADDASTDGGNVYLKKKNVPEVLTGIAVPYEGAVYYCDYEKIYRFKDGKTKAIIDANKLQAAAIGNNIGIHEGRIYFEATQGGDGIIYSIKPDGSERKIENYATKGYIAGYLYSYSNDSAWMHNGYVYYIHYNEAKRTITLYKTLPDKSETTKLGTFKTAENSEWGDAVIGQALYPVINGSEYIYFSYGYIAGTGLFFGSSRIARAKLDGSAYEIVDTSQDDNLGTLFSVNKDGSVNLSNMSLTYSELMTTCYMSSKGVCAIDPADGTGTLILSEKEYKKYAPSRGDVSDIDVEIYGSKAYVEMIFEEEGEMRWDRTETGRFLLEKDLDSGKITVVSKTKN